MLYFIPAWYQQNKCRETEQIWYERRMHTEFDDTVKQVQLFSRNSLIEFKILLLSYTPNFRHFLHRQGVYHAPYWSCFDAIQEVKRKKTVVFSFHDLKWPENIEFVYTPFLVIAYLDGKRYAQIDFGEDGNPIQVTMFKEDIISRKNVYDDRGFVSSSEIYEEGKLVYTDFLTDAGVVKLRVYEDSGVVEINQKSNTYIVYDQNGNSVETNTFKRTHYDSIIDVIKEVFQAQLRYASHEDIYCIAMHEINTRILEKILINDNYILSFYGDRYKAKDDQTTKAMIENAGYVITDSEATSKYLRRDVNHEKKNIVDISPYDSRTDFGISQQLVVQNIMVPVDELDGDKFRKVVINLAKYIGMNEHAMVHVFTRIAYFNRCEKLEADIAKILEEEGFDKRWVISEGKNKTAENNLMEEEIVEQRFFIDQCVDELAVSKCMREQRLMLDMSHNPNLYLQINCISLAIPQLVRKENQYIEDGKNGLVITDYETIPKALDFYLNGLNNWNNAKIASYEIGQQFTTKRLLEKWELVLKSMEK